MFLRFLDECGILFFRCLLFFLRSLPGFLFFGLVSGVEKVVFFVFSRRLRRSSLESLDIAFGGDVSAEEKKQIIRRSFRVLFIGLAGFFYDYAREQRVNGRFSLEGQEYLDAALKKGSGAVIAIGHFGPFVWMLLKLVACGYRVNIVARPPRSKVFRYFFDKALSICGMKVVLSVPSRACISTCIQALRRNEIVVTPIDQNYGGPGRVFVNFFGRLAATAPGTAIFSQEAGAPIFFAYALPGQKDGFRLIVTPVLLEVSGEKELSGQIMARVTALLEDVIRRHPAQWSWMHRRWKAVRKESEGSGG